MKYLIPTSLLLATMITGYAFAGPTPSANGAKVFFMNLKDGDTVTSPVEIKFGLEGMELAPAGIEKPMTGHHHLLIDREAFGKTAEGSAEADANIISDEHNVHFGKAQTETSVKLAPGKHTLQLVLGDKDHIPHNPAVVSDVITITVK